MLIKQSKRIWSSVFFCGILLIAGKLDAGGGQPSPVVVVEAVVTSYYDRVEALGTLRANETIDLTATVAEIVTAIHFDDGQRVEAGDILVEMTSKEEHALIEEERSTMAEAKKQYDRVRPLVKRGAASQALLDQRRREYQTSLARLRAIESKLQDRLIMAPFSGVVGLRNISVGALIEPGDVVTTLDDDSVMKLDFTVPAIYLSAIRVGLPIEARSPAFPRQLFMGEVKSISSRIDPVARSIVVRAVLPNPQRVLKPGLLMSVELLKSPRNAVVIPEEALMPSGRDNFVFVVDPAADPAVVDKRKVDTGERRPGQIEVLSGLTAGEFVVTHGNVRARPGQPVKVIAVDTGDEALVKLLNQERKGSGQ